MEISGNVLGCQGDWRLSYFWGSALPCELYVVGIGNLNVLRLVGRRICSAGSSLTPKPCWPVPLRHEKTGLSAETIENHRPDPWMSEATDLIHAGPRRPSSGSCGKGFRTKA